MPNRTKPRLPDATSRAWTGGFCVEKPEHVVAASAARGFVVLAGEATYLLRPGAAAFKVRDWSKDEGDLVAAAVDPRASARFAVAGMTRLVVFDGTSIGKMDLAGSEREVLGLAWGHGRLYVRFDDGNVLRVTPRSAQVDELELPHATALAADERGNVGVLCTEDDAFQVFTSADGETWNYRVLEPSDVDATPSLAIAGDAAAVSFAGAETWISRGREEPFSLCEPLARPTGPLAFEGGAGDAALFGVVTDGHAESIVRVDGAGSVVVARIETPGSEDASRIRALAWDASRRTLWGAAGSAGVFRASPPDAGRDAMLRLS